MLHKKYIFSLLLASFLLIAFSASASAKVIVRSTPSPETSSIKTPIVDCTYDVPAKEDYNAKFIAVRKKLRVEEEETFRVKVFIKNTGNMPWFSNSKSDCTGPIVSLGTDKERDHKSSLYSPKINKTDNNWGSENRVYMDQGRINPGQIASFTFWSEASDSPDVYKEYFTPVVEGVKWMDEARFSFKLFVGDADKSQEELKKLFDIYDQSGSLLDISLNGEKEILVDLSEQSLQIKLDGNVIHGFRVSTGKASTPTPTGIYSIKLKQDVRIGGKSPHYIMPKFMMFKDGGYGFHALPSLPMDRGKFWTEARAHIGIPVSHGCIRLLPEDANLIYGFVDLGTKVVIQK